MTDEGFMSDKEAIAAVKAGERAITSSSLKSEYTYQQGCDHFWREVACDSETDVIECSRCGKQKITPCTFDEDYA